MAVNQTTPKTISKLDQAVINKICAGEVIHRPLNVVKELIENSLDASATNIVVTLRNGGLRSITIQDNGSGIRKEDLPIACQRFTTSKLNAFEDLRSLTSFGFRGEALSSISTVSHLTIVSKVANSVCGYKAEYVDGSLKVGTKIVPIAANNGTTITVENLFYNMATRKAALSSESTECAMVQDLITRYAILYSSKCGFVLKKFGENTHLVNTSNTGVILYNINNLYKQNIAPNLIPFKLRNEKLSFHAEGFFSNANLNLKRFQFLLFINYRLVDCQPLKKSIREIYQSSLMKGGNPFVLLILHIDPRNIDVNVHPSKSEVCFLHQSEIMDIISRCIGEKLRTTKESNDIPEQSTHRIQTELNPAFFRTPTNDQRNNANNNNKRKEFESEPKKVVNLKSLSTTLAQPKAVIKSNPNPNPNQVKPQPQSTGKGTTAPVVRPQKQVRTDGSMQRLDQYIEQRKKESKFRRNFELTSLLRLRSAVFKRSDPTLLDVVTKSTYVGCVDENFLLLQHDLDLLMVNIRTLNEELFYQLILADFGNLDYIKFAKPMPIFDIISIYYRINAPNIADSTEEINKLVEIFVMCCEMLDDYFSLRIDPKTASLVALPRLIKGHLPIMSFLPDLMYHLGSNVQWEEEEPCIRDVAFQLARFYARTPLKLSTDEEYRSWGQVTEHHFFPLYKSLLCPSNQLVEKQAFHTVANITKLYTVFERC